MSAVLDPLEVDSIKSFLETTLNERCTIKSRTVANSGNGPKTTESDRATNVPCRRATNYRPSEAPVAGQTRAQEDVVVTVAIGQAVEETDRLLFTDGTSYEVTKVLATSHQAFCKRVLCRKV